MGRKRVESILPPEYYGRRVYLLQVLENPSLEFDLSGHADSPQHLAAHLREERLNEIQPRPMRGCKCKFKAIRHGSQIGSCFFGNMGGVIVQNDLDVNFGVVVLIQQCQKLHELAAAMPLHHLSVNMTCGVSTAYYTFLPWKGYSIHQRISYCNVILESH